MKTTPHNRSYHHAKPIFIAVLVGSMMTLSPWILAKPPAPPAVSQFAPADDLVAAVDSYLESIEKSLSVDAEDYTESKQNAVRKSAVTVSALALLASNHDQNPRMKASAADLLAAARQLGDSSADHAAAGKAFAAVKAAAKGEVSSNGAALEYQKVGSMEDLMKQVQSVNSRLKRGVRGSKLASQAETTAAYTVTLAAIAQAVMTDTSDVEKEEDTAKWYQFCADMRDAAGQLNQAIHQQDESAVDAALLKLKNSCDACHEVFEEDEL